jgi:hypothetical protein
VVGESHMAALGPGGDQGARGREREREKERGRAGAAAVAAASRRLKVRSAPRCNRFT